MATDNRVPVAQSAFATVTISVTRDTFDPQFTEQIYNATTINENIGTGVSVTRVEAFDTDLRVSDVLAIILINMVTFLSLIFSLIHSLCSM